MSDLVHGDPARDDGIDGERSRPGGATTLEHASAEGRWRPVLSEAQAEEALQAVDAISESIASLISRPGEREAPLAGGRAGLALLYAWLARTGRMPRADVFAGRCLDEAIEAVSAQAMNASLWGGFTGVAWAADLVDRALDPQAGDRGEAIDDALVRLLSRAERWPAPYDLVVGLTGLGVYALQRYPRPAAAECLRLVLERLHERARQDEHGVHWWTPPTEIASEEGRRQYPTGRGDLGVAHGVAGPIALLGGICAARVEPATARPLLEGAVRWLFAHSIPTEAGPTFPIWVAPGYEPTPARCAWCYGDPGIAAALLIAARGAGERDWEQAAVALACRAAERPRSQTGVVDACICHGAAGLAHVYNRMYQATGEPKLRRAARQWLEHTLGFYRRATENGGSWVQGSRDPARLDPWTGIDVVDGAAGVALVLLAGATSVEPTWDRMFLLSAPPAGLGTPGD